MIKCIMIYTREYLKRKTYTETSIENYEGKTFVKKKNVKQSIFILKYLA